ncbi:MAG: hypothetical protein M3313_16095 [Actinomycetota bacterium]|nr:hypothetical protein [Actinomycetota bacterium]
MRNAGGALVRACSNTLPLVEDDKFTGWLSGAPLGEPWVSLGGPSEGVDADEFRTLG